MSRQGAGLRTILSSRVVLACIVFTVAAFVAVLACIALGEQVLGLTVLGSATMLLLIGLIVLHQRNASAVARSLRSHGAQVTALHHMPKPAEQLADEVLGELRNENTSERLERIELSLAAILERLPKDSGDDAANRWTERDLELFLVHLLAGRRDGGNRTP